jgi:hypothetical protein
MKTISGVKVTSKGKLIGTINIREFDSVPEAQAELGDKLALELINVQYKTRAMNQTRQQAGANMSGKQLKQAALNRICVTPDLLMRLQSITPRITAEVSDKATADMMIAAEIDKLLLEVAATIKAENDAKLASLPDASEDDDGE